MNNTPLTVLYVDDEKSLLDIGKLFLVRSGGLKVDTTPSARDALELLSDISYDAVISDYQMPTMDGIELLKEVRLREIFHLFFLPDGALKMWLFRLSIMRQIFFLQIGGEPKSQFAELEHKVRQAVLRR